MTVETPTDNTDNKQGSDRKTGAEWLIHEIKELAQTIAIFLPIWMVFNTFAYELRSIPSESMVPALQVGDRVAVSKFAYGYTRHSPVFGIGRWFSKEDKADPEEGIMRSPPERGDVIVFQHPFSDKVMIKRLIGLPGDTIQLRSGLLYINGEAIEREPLRSLRYVQHNQFKSMVKALEYRETLPNGVSYLVHEFPNENRLDDTPVFQVPEGHVFMMGDNRDNSEDSRAPSGHEALARSNPNAWGFSFNPDAPGFFNEEDKAVGFVPVDHLMGRAETVLFTIHRCIKATGAECAKGRVWKGL